MNTVTFSLQDINYSAYQVEHLMRQMGEQLADRARNEAPRPPRRQPRYIPKRMPGSRTFRKAKYK